MAIRWRVLGCVVATSAGALAVSGGVLPAAAATAGYVEPVVFESGASADGSNQNAQEIFRVDSDGTNLRQLTTNSVPDGDAVWSPDATRLAFTRDFQQVFTMAADGSGVHAVSPLGYAAPVWSPDGTRLAYVSVRHQQVMVSGADGSDLRLVADVSPSSVRAVVWAPDGSRLAFALQHDEAVSENYDYGPPTEIDVVGADGSARHQVAAEAVDALGQPTWSPDGTLITYHRAGGIDVVRPDGTGHHVLLPEGNDLAWSPDGRRLAVVVPANVSTDFLDVVNADGSSPRVISRAPNQEDRAPQWLADGSGVVFTGYDETTPGRSHDIYAVDADGSNYRRLTTTTVADAARTPARVVRLAGATREDTAVSLSRATHASATTVVVARDDLYPDALAAGPLAATLNAPLLLSAPNSTTAALREEVRRLGATAAYLIGDTGALSARVESDLRGAGIMSVHRIGGQTRFDTAALIAEQVGGSAAYLARGVGATPSVPIWGRR